MKKVLKSKKKYVTLKSGGADFRKMAQIMTKIGYKMNHATARNQLIAAIESLFQNMATDLKTKITKKEIKDIASRQEVHEDLSDVIFKAIKELEEEVDDDQQTY